MNRGNIGWILLLVVILSLLAIPILSYQENRSIVVDDPWASVPKRPSHVDHTDLILGPFDDVHQVTETCLTCHEDAASQVMHTKHWRWESDPVQLPGRASPVTTGKKNTINNFCIGVQGNWEKCTSCHTGYGWEDDSFDFAQQRNVDCLVCHEQTGTYLKGDAGYPVEGVDILAAAQSVGFPNRQNCGSCHFRGGGGDAVKHGDLDESLLFPPAEVDVHMGRFDFTCTDCHQTDAHDMKGRSISVSLDNTNQAACTDCHNSDLHTDQRITAHVDTVACQTCHVPEVAVRHATKTHWDWSQAGRDDVEEDPHHYLKIKGEFKYSKNLQPEYAWFNGTADRYLLGDPILESVPTPINQPHGSIDDAAAKIWPFKIHRAVQPYDTEYNYLVQPKTVGEGGYWKTFDWDQAIRLGAEFTGLAYSGSYGFADTTMHWPLTHMVASKEKALQCQDCHGEQSRLDWQALGYPGDPLRWGSRDIDNQFAQGGQ